MRINAQLTQNQCPTHEPFSSCDLAHRSKPLLSTLVRTTSKFALIGPSALYLLISVPILILKRIYSLSMILHPNIISYNQSYTMWYLWSGTFLISHPYVFYFSIHLRCHFNTWARFFCFLHTVSWDEMSWASFSCSREHMLTVSSVWVFLFYKSPISPDGFTVSMRP